MTQREGGKWTMDGIQADGSEEHSVWQCWKA